METYCSAIGLPFSEHMLTWEPKHFLAWKTKLFHEVLHNVVAESTGFIKQSPTGNSEKSLEALPLDFQAAVKDAIPVYEKLYNVRMVPNAV